MTAVAPSLPASVTSAYAPDNTWLTQDVTSPTGKGPVSTGPVEPIGQAVNGTAPVDLSPPPLPWQEAELSAAPPDYFAEAAFPHAGPWPVLPAEPTGKEPFGTLPPDGITPAGFYKVPPAVSGLEQHQARLPGHDAHSQDTDTAGWDQYTPSGRVAVRQSWWQAFPGVENFWPITQPTQARTRLAVGGNQAVNGVTASYGGLASSGGNTAYEAPAPPAVTTQAAGATAAAAVPQWGM